jgi:hypothetical protein
MFAIHFGFTVVIVQAVFLYGFAAIVFSGAKSGGVAGENNSLS